MSNKNITSFHELQIKQEWELKDFAASASLKWQSILESKNELLLAFGEFEHAPISIQKEIVKMENDYLEEYGSNGSLINLLQKQHKAERVALALRLHREKNTNRDKDHER